MRGVLEDPKGSNAGYGVELIQGATGNKKGDAWCQSAVYYAGRLALGEAWPGKKTASCDEALAAARAKKRVFSTPQRGDQFFLMSSANPTTDAIHTGFVTEVHADGTFSTLEGNTNPKGGREGWGYYERRRDPKTQTYLFYRWAE